MTPAHALFFVGKSLQITGNICCLFDSLQMDDLMIPLRKTNMTMGKTNDFQDVSPIKTIDYRWFSVVIRYFRGGVNSELYPIESMGLVYFPTFGWFIW